ncbi:hypothetical protein EAG11_16550 [Flavobacterium sp. 140616W15]|nr:hypothetical protein EAG11_16550 [Flavobacterium sp. 140616W15]
MPQIKIVSREIFFLADQKKIEQMRTDFLQIKSAWIPLNLQNLRETIKNYESQNFATSAVNF